jgi:hypothetical protein
MSYPPTATLDIDQKITAQAFQASRAQPIENKYFSHNPFVMTILQMQNACNSLNTSGLS